MNELATLDAQPDPIELTKRLVNERAPDIVDALNLESPAVAAAVLADLPIDRAIEVLDQPGLEHVTDILQALPRNLVISLFSGMSADRVADVFRQLKEPARTDFLGHLDAETKNTIKALLIYPEDSAGSIMTTEFVSVPATWTVDQTLDHIRKIEHTRETVYSIYALDPVTGVLLKTVPLRRLITSDPKQSIFDAAPPRRPVTISATASRDEAARLISKYDLLSVAVIDDAGRPIGIVTVDDVIDSMVERQTEEVQRFGGMESLDKPYLHIRFSQMIRKRGGWLAILFLSEMLTATAMQGFQNELEKAIVLTLFIPLIMSSGGNSGSQATSLLIRALALQEVKLGDWWRVALRELPTGIMLGSILGGIGLCRIVAWQWLGLFDYGPHWLLVAVTVAVALVGIVTFGSMAGSMLPFILKRFGFDPATASAPFVATLVDVTGLVIYFGVAAIILRGTLL